jgi:hypothetical protein
MLLRAASTAPPAASAQVSAPGEWDEADRYADWAAMRARLGEEPLLMAEGEDWLAWVVELGEREGLAKQ